MEIRFSRRTLKKASTTSFYLLAAVCLSFGSMPLDPANAKDLGTLPSVKLRDGQTIINGYRLGRYPPREEYPEAYRLPGAFIEVTPKNRHQPVSEHFKLGQFLCKQAAGWPRYLALKPELLERLEQIVAVLSEHGVQADNVVIMSGYRTPMYNSALGNVPRSRHIYGDAADIFIDADGNKRMDDLNGDGRLDIGDAVWLARLIDSLAPRTAQMGLDGGLAVYPPTDAHGGFVHVDTRGFPVRWGQDF